MSEAYRRAGVDLGAAAEAVGLIRDLASGLFPRALTTDGLATALQDLARRSAVPVDIEVPSPDEVTSLTDELGSLGGAFSDAS